MKAVIDIGNSNVKCGFLSSNSELERTSIYSVSNFADGIGEFLGESISAIAVGVSGKNDLAQRIAAHFRGSATVLLPVSAAGPLPFASCYARGQAGVDRLANVAAVVATHPTPAIVVDAGTAITTEVVDRDGAFKGGAIMPGLKLQARSLQQGTASLPEITTASQCKAIGSTTRAAIEAGLLHGIVGAVRNLLSASVAELGNPADWKLIVTGGDGPMLARLLNFPNLHHDADLTLRGLVILARHQYPGSF